MRTFIYIIGFLIVIAGLAWAALSFGVPEIWVVIGSVILLGLGLIGAANRPRYRRGGGVTVVQNDEDLL